MAMIADVSYDDHQNAVFVIANDLIGRPGGRSPRQRCRFFAKSPSIRRNLASCSGVSFAIRIGVVGIYALEFGGRRVPHGLRDRPNRALGEPAHRRFSVYGIDV